MTDWYKIKRILVRQNNQEKQIYPTAYPKAWLIWHYTFENDTNNDTLLHDVSWLGNNGTRNSTYWEIVTGWKVWDKCLYKNAVNKAPWQVDRTSTFTYSTAITFMWWCKSVNAAVAMWLWGFFNWESPYTNQRCVAIRWLNDKYNFIAWNNSWWDGYDSTNWNIDWDWWVWTHYAVTYDNTHTAKLYRHWTLVKTIDTGYWFAWTTVPFYFASIGSWWGWAGYIDDVLVYNRVLTADEIANIYNKTK
jgi:hypothetical protein